MYELRKQYNKRFHSPLNVYKHILWVTDQVGIDVINTSPSYKKVREARIVNIMAFVLSRLYHMPIFIRLTASDPPDAYLMQPFAGTMNILPVEITSYRESDESLLEQLKRTKFNRSYPKEYLMLIELLSKDKVNFSDICKYKIDNNISWKIALLSKLQDSPDTIAEVIVIDSAVTAFNVNVGLEASNYKRIFNLPDVIFTGKVFNSEDVRTESAQEECKIAPWEDLDD